MGGLMAADGRMIGDQQTIEIACDQAANTCTIPVKAPSFALVFLSDIDGAAEEPTSTLTFATTAYTAHGNQIVLVNPSVLATMNGDGGTQPRYTGSTSKNATPANDAMRLVAPAASLLVAMVIGCFVVRWAP